MTLHYQTEPVDYKNQHHLSTMANDSAARQNYSLSFMMPILFAAVAIVTNVGKNPAVAILVAVVLCLYLYPRMSYDRHMESVLKAVFDCKASKEVTLIVNDKGLHEECGGMTSFCPWESVQGFALFENTIFISLENDLWAIIPKRTLQEPLEFEGIMLEMESRAIPQLQAPSSAC